MVIFLYYFLLVGKGWIRCSWSIICSLYHSKFEYDTKKQRSLNSNVLAPPMLVTLNTVLAKLLYSGIKTWLLILWWSGKLLSVDQIGSTLFQYLSTQDKVHLLRAHKALVEECRSFRLHSSHFAYTVWVDSPTWKLIRPHDLSPITSFHLHWSRKYFAKIDDHRESIF